MKTAEERCDEDTLKPGRNKIWGRLKTVHAWTILIPMSKTMKAAITVTTFILCLVLTGCVSVPAARAAKADTLFFAPAVVDVAGVLARRRYLSVMEGSRKEMINESVVVVLDRPVAIVPDPEKGAAKDDAIANVKEIEITNEFDFDFHALLGKQVAVKGMITRIEEMRGFHRQMSTPVEIHVMKLTVSAE